MQRRGITIVGLEEGTDLAKEIGAAGYFETSALKVEGLEELFDACLGIGVENKGTKRKGKGDCSLL